MFSLFFFFFNDTATTEIYTLSLHDALPIFAATNGSTACSFTHGRACTPSGSGPSSAGSRRAVLSSTRTSSRSEEHTSELQSRQYLVCRLLLEKKKKHNIQKQCSHERIIYNN